jgi:hypothetical protein
MTTGFPSLYSGAARTSSAVSSTVMRPRPHPTTPTVLPPYARPSKSLEVLIPILQLKGVSTGEFEEVPAALVGKNAPSLSVSTIGRLKEVRAEEHAVHVFD